MKYKTAKEARRLNLERLVDEYKTQRAFGEAARLAPAFVSQLLTGHREMGDDVARKIESNLGLSSGQLDYWQDPGDNDGDEKTKAARDEIAPAARGSMVPVFAWEDLPSIIKAMRQSNMPPQGSQATAAPENVGGRGFAVTIQGEANSPKLQPGDQLFINPDLSAQPGDFVLVELPGGEFIVRRLQVGDESGFFLKAENQGWPDRIIRLETDAEIVGVAVANTRALR